MESNKYDVKIKTSEKWNYSESIPLCYVFTTYHCLPPRNITTKIVMNEK